MSVNPNLETPILYSQPGCVQCRAVKRFLNEREIPFEEVDLTEDSSAFDLVKNQWGYRGVPVLSFNDSHFQGFDPGELARVAEEYASDSTKAVA